jgi:hypothetical protein
VKRITAWLGRTSPALFSIYAVVMAFSTYFAMYSFRKPFTVGHYEGDLGGLELKAALVIGQLCGYALSKMLGIKVNSEMTPGRRARVLVGLIVVAELALLAFAVLPPGGKVVALFVNGIPLGTVWGIVFSFLEGRRTSEILGAGLSCAYVVAGGPVKTIGKTLLGSGISEDWMPAMVGAMFLPVFLAAVYGLSLLPPPNAGDIAARTVREPMNADERRAFVRKFLPGLLLLVVTYLALTSYRDFRDVYAAEIFRDLGMGDSAGVFTWTELPIGIAVMIVLGLLYFVRDNRRGLILTYVIMAMGAALVGITTLLFDAGAIGPKAWMILVGLGLYLGYVPYGCVLFDRTIAALGIVATAVFLIYVSDAVAYGGSVLVVVYKNVGQANQSMLDFFRAFSYTMSVVCVVCFTISGYYYIRRAKR